MVTQVQRLQQQRQQQLKLQRDSQRRQQQAALRGQKQADTIVQQQAQQQKLQQEKAKQEEEKLKAKSTEQKKIIEQKIAAVQKEIDYFTRQETRGGTASRLAASAQKYGKQAELSKLKEIEGELKIGGTYEDINKVLTYASQSGSSVQRGFGEQFAGIVAIQKQPDVIPKGAKIISMKDGVIEYSMPSATQVSVKPTVGYDAFGQPVSIAPTPSTKESIIQKYFSGGVSTSLIPISPSTTKAPTITAETKRYESFRYSKPEAQALAKESVKLGGVSFTPEGAKQVLQEPRGDLSGVSSDFKDVGMGSIFGGVSAQPWDTKGLKGEKAVQDKNGTDSVLPRGDYGVPGGVPSGTYLGDFTRDFSDFFGKGLATETKEFGTVQAKPLVLKEELEKKEREKEKSIWTRDISLLEAEKKEYEKLTFDIDKVETEKERNIRLQKLSSLGAGITETPEGFEITPPKVDVIPGKKYKKEYDITSFDFDTSNAFSSIALGTDIIFRTAGAVGGKITTKATEKYYKAKGFEDDLDVIRKEFKTDIIQEQYGTQQYDALTGKAVPFFKPVEITVPELTLGQRKKQAEKFGEVAGGVSPYFVPYLGSALFYSQITGSIGKRTVREGSIIKGTTQFVKEEPFNAIMLGSIGAFKVGKGAYKAYPGAKAFTIKTGKKLKFEDVKSFSESPYGILRSKKGQTQFSELEQFYKKKKKKQEFDLDSPFTELFIMAETKRAGEYEKLLGQLRKAKNKDELKNVLSKFKDKKLSEFEKSELQRLVSQKTFEITGQNLIFTDRGYFISGRTRPGVKGITRTELSILTRIKAKPVSLTREKQDTANILRFGLSTKQKEETKQITKLRYKTKQKIDTTFSQLILQGTKQTPAQKEEYKLSTPSILIGRTTQVPRIKKPKFKFDYEQDSAMRRLAKQPTHLYVKSGKKFIRATKKPVERKVATDMGFYITDQTLSRQFKLSKAKGKAHKPSFNVPVNYGNIFGYKFRPYKQVKKQKIPLINRYIEKKNYIGDTQNELRRLSAAKFIAQQRKQVPKVKAQNIGMGLLTGF